MKVNIPQLVTVKKYDVDCKALCSLLRHHKSLTKKSNKALAEALNVTTTKVEHWFRTDSGFAIPDADVWERLKTELGITTTEFDEAITVFEERPGVYEKLERCYLTEGIAPTLTSTLAGEEKIIVGEKTMDKNETKENYFIVGGMRKNQAVKTDGVCTTLTSSMGMGGGYVPMHNCTTDLRIRKLTPKECFRLMGFDDSDFEKAEAVNSNTQLYKQAGNSIVVPVVQYILKELFDCGALHV